MLPMRPAKAQAILAGAEAFNQPLEAGYRRELEAIAAVHTAHIVRCEIRGALPPEGDGIWRSAEFFTADEEEARDLADHINSGTGRYTRNARVITQCATDTEG